MKNSFFYLFTLLFTTVPIFFSFNADASVGDYLNKWGNYGAGDGQFDYPRGIAVDESGYVYVVDTQNNRIQVFDSTGDYLNQWGSRGAGDGQFFGPYCVAIDAGGYIYVTDTFNHRIQVFDSAGNYLNQWGSRGAGDGQFDYPVAVAVDASGHVYVADLYNHRIQVFDSAGNYLNQWGSRGAGDGQFNYPFGVAVDAVGHVYVSDAYSNRIQVFDSAGNYQNQWGSTGYGNGQFQRPFGLAVDAVGHVYVVDIDNNRIQVFDSNGNYLNQWGSEGYANGQFRYPRGVAVDASGYVYVADTQNYRIQVFEGYYVSRPPEAACKDIEIALDKNGQAAILAGDADGGSNDPDGDSIELSIDKANFTCADLGDNTVTLTVTDDNGAEDSCTAIITVVDVTPPEVLCSISPMGWKKVINFSAYDNCAELADGQIIELETYNDRYWELNVCNWRIASNTEQLIVKTADDYGNEGTCFVERKLIDGLEGDLSLGD